MLGSNLESEQSEKRSFLEQEHAFNLRRSMKPKRVSELSLPVTGATAGLSSSANHQRNLPPDLAIGYNPCMPLTKPHRK